MKIKNVQVFDESNQAAMNELMQKDLVGIASLKAVKAARKLDELLTDIHKAIKVIREKYTVKDENGNPVHPIENGQPVRERVKISNPEAFNKELAEILNVENELALEEITEKEIEGVKISPKTIMILSWLIKQ